MIEKFYEKKEDLKIWSGRIDDASDKESYRWHQVVKRLHYKDLATTSFPEDELGICFIGFCCDAGIKLNLGRTGASKGPKAIRTQMSNLPYNFDDNIKLYDVGNIVCHKNTDLAFAQESLEELVAMVMDAGLFPLVLGGGHEVAYGNFNGIKKHLLENKQSDNIGIINFDAHFDMRPYNDGRNSGTMFRQIYDDRTIEEKKFNYMVLGIQNYGNTKSLFRQADELGVKYIKGDLVKEGEMINILNKVHGFIRGKDAVHLTICTDVFSAAFAPGVSAPQPFGIDPKVSLGILKNILKSGKVASIDIAEISPRFDEDNITSKLGSFLIYEMISALASVYNDQID